LDKSRGGKTENRTLNQKRGRKESISKRGEKKKKGALF